MEYLYENFNKSSYVAHNDNTQEVHKKFKGCLHICLKISKDSSNRKLYNFQAHICLSKVPSITL